MMYTIDEVAEKLKVHERTVRAMVKRGDIKSFKVGSQYRISDEQLQEYLKANTTKNKGE